MNGRTATWMIMLCEKTGISRWPLRPSWRMGTGWAGFKTAAGLLASVFRAGEALFHRVRLYRGAARRAREPPVLLAAGRAGGARDAAADAGAARRAQPGLEGSAGRAAEVRARVLVRHRSHVDQQSGISPTQLHLRGIEKAGQEIPENLIHRERRSLRAQSRASSADASSSPAALGQ